MKLSGVEGGDRGFSPFNRDKDDLSYEGGRAHDGQGQPKAYDLNITVFSDNDGTAVLLSKTTGRPRGPPGRLLRHPLGADVPCHDGRLARRGRCLGGRCRARLGPRLHLPRAEGRPRRGAGGAREDDEGRVPGLRRRPPRDELGTQEVPLEAGKTYYIRAHEPHRVQPLRDGRPRGRVRRRRRLPGRGPRRTADRST